MKKTLLLISSILIGVTSFAQMEGFENWSNNSVQLLDDYETAVNDWGVEGANACFPSTDANSGTYSIRLETVLTSFGDTIFGYFVSGDPDNMSPGQAVSLPAVDSLIGYYKYDIQAGDSAVILTATTFMSNLTGGGTFYVKGQQSTWKRFSYPIMAPAADSILLAAACGDPLNNFNGIPGSWIQFDDVQLKDGSQTQNILNSGFENWTPFNWEDPIGWATSNRWAVGEPTLPVNKTTDSYAGTYAIELTKLLSTNGDTLWGGATNGEFGEMGPVGGQPFSGGPTLIECYYKYAPVTNDIGSINIEFRQNGNVVGNYGTGVNAAGTYQLWNQAISGITPDTILISLWSGDSIGSVLKVDNIDVSFPVGIAEGLTVEKIVSYPNPATDVLNLRFDIAEANNVTIRLVDVTGKTIVSRNLGTLSAGTHRESFNTSSYSSGLYFVEFDMNGEKQTKRFVIR